MREPKGRGRGARGLGRRWRGLVGAATIAAALAPFAGPPVRAESDVWRLAESERLQLRAQGLMLQAGRLDRRGLMVMDANLRRQGYGRKVGASPIVARAFEVAPVLSWDGNINGGVLQDRLVIDGLVFEADPAFRAKAGLVLGGKAAGLGRFAWARGRTIDIAGGVELAWSPRHEIGRADAALSLCARNHLTGWNFLDFCALGTRSWRELERSSAHRFSMEYSRIFTALGKLNEGSLRLDRVSTSGGDQNRLRLGIESLGRATATGLALTLGETVGETTVLKDRIDVTLAFHALRRDWRLEVWRQRADGGRFLGRPRKDSSLGLSLSVTPVEGVTLRLGAMHSRSTAAIADYGQVTLDLTLSGLGLRR